MKIKFIDIPHQDKDLQSKILKSFMTDLKKGDFILGKNVESVEKTISKLLRIKYCCLVSNGTDAISLSLRALNIPKNGEIITTSFTAFATLQGIINAGYKPVMADINPDTFNICPKSINKLINKKTQAIVPVHIFGNPCSMDKITKIAKKNNLKLIEDCAQSFGAKFKNKYCGSMSDISAFSFYPTKNLGAYGDAGMVATNNLKYYNKILRLRNQGLSKNKKITSIGHNCRCDTVQASILKIKLSKINKINRYRLKLAKYYDKKLKNISEIKIPITNQESKSIYHQYTIKALKRDRLKKFLENNNIETMIYYEKPIFNQKPMKNSFKKFYKNYEVNKITKLNLSLPIYPTLTFEKIDKITNFIKLFYEKIN